MATLKLLVVTPERKVAESEEDLVELPGAEGYLGILPGHTPLIAQLKTGVVSWRHSGASESLAVSAGLAEISQDRVAVLADSAEAAAQIDAAAAEREKAEAEKQMSAAGVDTLPGIQARFELAQARLAVARKG